MKLPALTPKLRIYYRILSLVACLLVIMSIFIPLAIGKEEFFFMCEERWISVAWKTYLVTGIIAFFLFTISACRPEHLYASSTVCLLYCLLILLNEPRCPLAVFMWGIGIIALFMLGYFEKNGNLKFASLLLFYFIGQLPALRFGKKIFLDIVLYQACALCCLSAIFIFATHIIKNTKKNANAVIELSEYNALNENDIKIILLLMEGQKYDWIARTQGIATSTLKKHVRRIFSVLSVADLAEFKSKFCNRTIAYHGETLHF